MPSFFLNLFQPFRAYFERTREYSIPRFIIELTLLAFPLKIVFLLPYALSGGEFRSTTEAADTGDPLQLLVIACIVAPVLETFLGQWIPIRVAWFFTKRWLYLILFSTIVFAAQHLHVGMGGFVTTFPVAALLAWSFLVHREHSRWRAYWVTSAIHALHNFISAGIYLLAYAGQKVS